MDLVSNMRFFHNFLQFSQTRRKPQENHLPKLHRYNSSCDEIHNLILSRCSQFTVTAAGVLERRASGRRSYSVEDSDRMFN